MFPELVARVMDQFDGHLSVHDTWVFSSSTAAVIAADEIFRLGKEEVIAVVITGETHAGGPMRGVLSDRAQAACAAVNRIGVYTCRTTRTIAELNLPSQMWLVGVGSVEIESGGVEELSLLCHGSDQPNTGPVSTRGTRIPKPNGTFVGRDAQLDELVEKLVHQQIVTLTGLPGIGKSTLATIAVRAVENDFEDGIYWIDCSQCESREQLLRELQEAVRPGRARQAEPLFVLADFFREMSALVVFDNCEGLIDEVREITSALGDASTNITILGTSAIPLRLKSEHIMALGPLTLPPEGDEVGAIKDFNSDAVSLFAERAGMASDKFTLTVDNVRAVSEICRELGGIPLSIEIFASKLGKRSLKALASQLPKALELTWNTPSRAHHKSLGAAIEYAIQRIPEYYRGLLDGLSLFAGSFTFDQVSAVLGTEAMDLSIAEQLDFLVEASVLELSSDRYSLPGPIRLFLDAKLRESEAGKELRRLFCEGIFDVVGASKAAFDAREDHAPYLLDPYNADIDNAFRMSFEFPEIHPRVNEILKIIPHYWQSRNRLLDVDPLLEEVLRNVVMTQVERSRCLNLLGAARMCQEDYDTAESCFLEAVRLCLEAGETVVLPGAYGNLGYICKLRGEFEQSANYNAKALVAAREEGVPLRIMVVLVNWGDSIRCWLQSDDPPPNFEDVLNEGREIADEIESLQPKMPIYQQSLDHLRGELEFAAGNLDASERHFTRASLTCEAAGFGYEAAQALDRLGEIELMRGNCDRAAKLFGCCLAIRVRAGKFRLEPEEAHVSKLLAIIADRIGADHMEEHFNYGGSAAICDLCVPI